MQCYYHNDLDGKCSAAIVLRSEPECKLIPIDYRDRFRLDRIEKDEQVVIVDFSFQKENDWKNILRRTDDIVWIDHHESAIRKAEEFGIDQLPGIRKVGQSGCLLTWTWYRSQEPVPQAIELINKWDLWTHGDDPAVVQFIFGMKLENTHPKSRLWDFLFGDGKPIPAIQKRGAIIEAYERKKNIGYLRKFGFEIEFEGYRCLVCNIGLASSKLFDSVRDEDYDLFITFVHDGEKYSFYLFSKTVPVNRIAEKYGGGGHRGAAGFTCLTWPFSGQGRRIGLGR